MTQLLVSVRSVEEALAAFDGGADLIDVKEPANGSLGRADEATVHAIVRAIAGRRPVSAALGEWADRKNEFTIPGLAYVKWGLAGCGDDPDWRSALTSRLQSTGSPPLVLVAYADWQCAQAPPFADVLQLACENPGSVMLIDTHCKVGANGHRPTLLDWLPAGEVQRVLETARGFGIRIALAGSLGPREIAALGHLQPHWPDWFAVRGAACGDGDRSNAIEMQKVKALADLIRPNIPHANVAD